MKLFSLLFQLSNDTTASNSNGAVGFTEPFGNRFDGHALDGRQPKCVPSILGDARLYLVCSPAKKLALQLQVKRECFQRLFRMSIEHRLDSTVAGCCDAATARKAIDGEVASDRRKPTTE